MSESAHTTSLLTNRDVFHCILKLLPDIRCVLQCVSVSTNAYEWSKDVSLWEALTRKFTLFDPSTLQPGIFTSYSNSFTSFSTSNWFYFRFFLEWLARTSQKTAQEGFLCLPQKRPHWKTTLGYFPRTWQVSSGFSGRYVHLHLSSFILLRFPSNILIQVSH